MSMAMVNINYNKIFEIFENSIAISLNVATSSISVLRFLKRNITSQHLALEASPRSVVEGEGEGGGEGDDKGGEEQEEAGGKGRP